jgi:hypothetical protein
MYQMLTRNLPLHGDYQPIPGFISEEVHFRGIEDFELRVYNYFFSHEEMLQKVIQSVTQFAVGGDQFRDC